MSYYMDRELQFQKYPMFKNLRQNKLLNNFREFLKFKSKVKKSGIKLTGHETGIEVYQMLQLKLNSEILQKEKYIKRMRDQMKNDTEKGKDKLASILSNFLIDTINPHCFDYFTDKD